MPDNSWLRLAPKDMAHARMYSGCCAGGGSLWYFGGAHRSYQGNDVELYDPRANAWLQPTGRWANLWCDADHNVHLFVSDVKRDRRELFDGGVTETWASCYRRTGEGRTD